MKWEYRSLKMSPKLVWGKGETLDCDKLLDHMNRLGEEGWELASSLDINAGRGRTNEVVLLFKRARAQDA